MKHCLLSSRGIENDNAQSNGIVFIIKNINLYVPVVTLSAKGN